MKIGLTGDVIFIGDEQTFNKGFVKRDIVVDISDNPMYPNEIQITFMKDKTSLLDDVNKGDSVEIGAFISGRSHLKEGMAEADRKWFNQIVGLSLYVKTKTRKPRETNPTEKAESRTEKPTSHGKSSIAPDDDYAGHGGLDDPDVPF